MSAEVRSTTSGSIETEAEMDNHISTGDQGIDRVAEQRAKLRLRHAAGAHRR